MHSVLAAIIVEAHKLRKNSILLDQFSSKLNKLFHKFLEYLDTKSTLKKCFPKIEKILNLSAEIVAENVIKFFLEISQIYKINCYSTKL